MPEKKGMTYADAGVNIGAAMTALDLIKRQCSKTHDGFVASGIGLFGSALDLSLLLQHSNMSHPYLIQSIDGPGTVPLLAKQVMEQRGDYLKCYKDIGYSVAMHCFCDIATCGARPITLLDNIGSTDMEALIYEAIISGMAEACLELECRLVGGESAQLPGVIMPGAYDFCACVTGLVDFSQHINPLKKIYQGDFIVGIGSNGLLLNGWSLARKIMDKTNIKATDYIDFSGKSFANTFITREPSYPKIVNHFLNTGLNVHGYSHITGGGLYDNIERILPENCRAMIDTRTWPMPQAFDWLVKNGEVELKEAYHTWNMGIGYVAILEPDLAEKAVDIIRECFGLDAWVIGEIVEGQRGVEIDFH